MLIAKEHERERNLALRKDPWFDYAGALLQIGIVLAAVAIITATPALLYGAIVPGTIGVLSTANGFLLLL